MGIKGGGAGIKGGGVGIRGGGAGIRGRGGCKGRENSIPRIYDFQ